MFEWTQFMNNPESSDSCSLQVNVQTVTENKKFTFNRILQMTYNLPDTYIKKKKGSVLRLQFLSF